MNYYAIATNLGAAKFAELVATGQQLILQDFAVGDGNGSAYGPVATQNALRREMYRAVINSLTVDSNNDKQVIIECLIPENSGGWYIRELGIFDEAGDLILVAKYPETYKPSPADGALLKQFTIKMVMEVGSPDNVALSIEAGSVATTEYVDNKKALLTDETVTDLSNDENYLTAYVFANLAATVNKYGVTKLANDLEVKQQSISDKVITPASLPALRPTLNELKAGKADRFVNPAILLQLIAATDQLGLTTLATDAIARAMASQNTTLTPKNLAALKATLAELTAGNANRLISADILMQLLATTTQKGLVELATAAETLAQTETDKAVTPSGLTSLIATLAEAKAGSNAVKYITPAVLLQLLATTTQKGLVELATGAETLAQTETDKAVTPSGLASLIATLAEAQAGTNAVKYITPSTLASIITGNGGGIIASGTGWFKFKNGVIVQYGQTVIFSTTPQVQSLPISFSNAFYHIFLSALGSNALNNNNVIYPNNSSSFALQSAAGQTVNGSYLAIGV